MRSVGQPAETAGRTMQAIMQDGYGSADVLRLAILDIAGNLAITI